jgi:DNA transformation protein
MTARPDEFTQYCCELLFAVSMCTARRMFAGYGISMDGLTLGLLADPGQGEKLWLKTGPETRSLFKAAECERFTHQVKGKARSLGYYSAPDEAIKSANEMAPWARLVFQAALANQTKPNRTKPNRTKPTQAKPKSKKKE